jgi:hypothetical protein
VSVRALARHLPAPVRQRLGRVRDRVDAFRKPGRPLLTEAQVRAFDLAVGGAPALEAGSAFSPAQVAALPGPRARIDFADPAAFVGALNVCLACGVVPDFLFRPGSVPAHVTGIVPYDHGFTEVLVYNFFDRHYGIRDPIFYRLLLVAGLEVRGLHKFALEGNRSARLVASDLFKGIEVPHGMLALQAFHPRITAVRERTAEHRFFGFLGAADRIAGVHSLGLLAEEAREAGPRARVYVPTADLGHPERYRYHAVSEAEVALADAERASMDSPALGGHLSKLRTARRFVGPPIGFVSLQDGGPVAVWHDAPVFTAAAMPASTRIPAGGHPWKIIVPLVDFGAVDTFVAVDPEQITSEYRGLDLRLHAWDGREVAATRVPLGPRDHSIPLRRLFADVPDPDDVAYCAAELVFDEACKRTLPETLMLHTFFRRADGTYLDVVHSNISTGFMPGEKVKGTRCRKFGALVHDDVSESEFHVYNVGLVERTPPVRVLVRTILADGEEVARWHEIPSNGVLRLSSAELLAPFGRREGVGVVYLEQNRYNLTANWIRRLRRGGAFAVDHFTGA